jgi:hypothetical protein
MRAPAFALLAHAAAATLTPGRRSVREWDGSLLPARKTGPPSRAPHPTARHRTSTRHAAGTSPPACWGGCGSPSSALAWSLLQTSTFPRPPRRAHECHEARSSSYPPSTASRGWEAADGRTGSARSSARSSAVSPICGATSSARSGSRATRSPPAPHAGWPRGAGRLVDRARGSEGAGHAVCADRRARRAGRTARRRDLLPAQRDVGPADTRRQRQEPPRAAGGALGRRLHVARVELPRVHAVRVPPRAARRDAARPTGDHPFVRGAELTACPPRAATGSPSS